MLSQGSLFDGYDVVVCKACGFGFADDIPEQTEFNLYYEQMSKYENEYLDGKVSDAAISTYDSIVRIIQPFLSCPSDRIIDIGCATGTLLSMFKKAGFDNVIGVDPSPACALTAQRLYDIRVLNHPISEIPNFEAPFDFVILNSVLEHIRDLRPSLSALCNLLKPGGLIWIETPDVARFGDYVKVAFQQFSMEHINFFSLASLTNLMIQHGFEPVASWQNERRLEAVCDPALSTIFRKQATKSGNVDTTPDIVTFTALQKYIEISAQVDQSVLAKIEEIVIGQQKIIVWGVGTHTQRLLASSRLAQANIAAFVDSNTNYQGKQLNGIPILPPERLLGRLEPILISSYLYQEEISKQIRETLRLNNEIIRLYQ